MSNGRVIATTTINLIMNKMIESILRGLHQNTLRADQLPAIKNILR